jgi:hypothetical protein
LVHSFRSFSPWSLNTNDFGPVGKAGYHGREHVAHLAVARKKKKTVPMT